MSRNLLLSKKIAVILIVLAGLLVSTQISHAQITYTWTGTANNAWNNTANWTKSSGTSYPGTVATDIVIIPATGTLPTLSTALTTSIASLTFTGNTTLTITGQTLTVTGTVTMNSADANRAVIITGSGTLTCGSCNVGTTFAVTGNRTTLLTSTLVALNVTSQITLTSSYNTIASRRNSCTLAHTSGIITAAGITTITPAGSTSAYTMGASTPTLKLTGATPWTIGSGGTNTITLTGTNATVDYQSTSDITFLAAPAGLRAYRNLTISGGGGVVKTLGANTTASGVVTVRANSTLATGTFTLGAAGLTLETVGGGNGSSIAGSGAITLNGNVTLNYTGSGAITTGASIAPPIILSATRSISVNDDANSTTPELTMSGIISGAFGITKLLTGTLVLSGTNTYTGITTISAGKLSATTIGNGGASGNIGAASNAAANLVFGGGTLQYTGATASTNRNFTLNTGTTSSIDVTANTLTISGASTATTGALTKIGNGTLILSGANLHTGLTSVGEGTLRYGINSALSSGSVTVNGGTLDIGTYTDAVGTVTLTNGSIVGTTGVLTGTSYAMQNGTVSAILAGAVTLTKTTSGTVILSGANSYTGLTSVSSGIVNIQNATALGTTALGTTVSSGAALQIQGGITVGAETLSLNGTGISNDGALRNISGDNTWGGAITLADNTEISSDAGTLSLSGNMSGNFTLTLDGAGSGNFSGVRSGTGALIKNGNGIWTLTGANSYTGTTTITNGELRLNPTGNIAPNTQVILNGGTLSTTGITATRTITNASTLKLDASSTIDLGSNEHTITFADSHNIIWAGSSLTINGWTGTAGQSNTSGGKIFVGVGGLDATQLAKISFAGFSGTPILLGTSELVPPAVTLATDYFRSKTTGNWSATSTWESSPDGISWINATVTPTSAANIITVRTGHTVSVNSSLSVDQTVIDNGGTVGINNGQTLTLADGSGTDLAVNGSLIVSGTFISSGTITTSGTVTFNSGATYEHVQNGGTIPTASWNASSTCLITGMTTTGPAGLNQTFGNLTWNCASQTGNTTPAGDITVQGNFVLSNGAFTLSDGPARNMFIGGNYMQTNGLFDFNVGTSGTFLTKMYVAGNFLNTASATESMSTMGNGRYNGEIIFNGSGTQTLSFTNPDAARWISYTIEPSSTVQLLSDLQLYGDNGSPQYYANFTVNGTLDAGTFSITDGVPQANATVVVVNSGANFITANSNGISGTFPSATTTKTFSSSANYEFQGAATGTFVTTPNANTVNNLIVNRSAGVTLSQNIAVAGNLIFTSGILISTTSNLLSITNTSTSAISGASSSSFIIGPVKWILPSSLGSGSTYIFPTGKGSAYLPFSLFNPTTGTGTVTAQVEAFAVNAGGSFDATLESISTTEYWSLATTGNFTNSSISLDRGISNDPLDVIGGSVSVAGTYTSLEGTPVSTGVSGSDPIGTYRYFVLAEKKKTTIATGSIGTPFCAGSSVSVPFTITGIYTSGNVFTAQLSNASGSFSTPVNIGTLTSVSAGTITGIIPVATAAGTGYRIRVVSNLPAATGSDNGSDLTVTAQVIANVTIAANQNNVCSGTSVSFTATPTNGGTTPSYQWKVNGNNAGTNSASYSYVPLNSDIVTCVLTSNANCVTGSPATSNAITMTVNPLPATGEIVGD
ncbi:MAG: autotransporter-associated beta strand repeat-containing protein [Prolixibacteraceae bacterium]|nr:autotransporter-associated beta strand repeat-containing protein [Prolixibacteraceae bacterium]